MTLGSQQSFGDMNKSSHPQFNVRLQGDGSKAEAVLEEKDKEDTKSQLSFGTGSFTTNTFQNKLAGSCGMKLLRYVSGEEFGKFGESMELMEHI